jgi:hypothetical protein
LKVIRREEFTNNQISFLLPNPANFKKNRKNFVFE